MIMTTYIMSRQKFWIEPTDHSRRDFVKPRVLLILPYTRLNISLNESISSFHNIISLSYIKGGINLKFCSCHNSASWSISFNNVRSTIKDLNLKMWAEVPTVSSCPPFWTSDRVYKQLFFSQWNHYWLFVLQILLSQKWISHIYYSLTFFI